MRGIVRCLALLLGWSAASSSAHAWRGASELPELGGADHITWSSRDLRYSVVPDPPSGWTDAAFLNASGRAVDTWNAEACGPTIGLVSAPSRAAISGDGIVTVEALRSSEWRSRGFDELTAATTDVLYERSTDGWQIIDAEIIVNGGIRWGEDGSDGIRPDIEGAVAHEWGHAVGLLHCCEPSGSDGAPACDASPHCEGVLMYPLHQGLAHRALGDDDRAGVCALYPAAACEGRDCPQCDVDGDCVEPERCREGRCVVVVAPERCTQDSDCDPGRRCSSGRCVSSELGDPCGAPEECTSGRCEAGFCTERCADDLTCPAGFECAGGGCQPAGGGFAEACTEASHCGTRVCVEGSSTDPFCSRNCSEVRPCPAGWSCGEASGESVCVPAPLPAGCSTSHVGAHGGATLLILLPLLLWSPRRRMS